VILAQDTKKIKENLVEAHHLPNKREKIKAPKDIIDRFNYHIIL